MALNLLATAYCRSGRVLLAEGLLREASKTLHLSREAINTSWSPPDGCHASCVARVAWQHAQLLSALPKRGTEAQGWSDVARNVWKGTQAMHDHAGQSGEPAVLEDVFGDLSALTGKGRRGKLHVMVMWLGRVFPGPVDIESVTQHSQKVG